MVRSVASVRIAFGLIRIPVKFYTSALEESIKFSLLSPKGNRIERRNFDAVTGEEVPYEECDRGFEVTKGEFTRFKKEELETLEAEALDIMQIVEFIPGHLVTPLWIEKTYYLGPDLGADKGYRLLQAALVVTKRVAVAQWVVRGKEHLVVIAPHLNGLVLHQMFYSNEVRDFHEITSTISPVTLTDAEHEMAEQLIHLSSTNEFIPSEYTDRYATRVREAIKVKIAGEGVLKAQEPAKPRFGGMNDFTHLLRLSINEVEGKTKKTRKKVKTTRLASSNHASSKKKKKQKKNVAQQTLGI